jgi:hypothetical protein
LNIIQRKEPSWRINFKNQGYIIPEIIGTKNYLNNWMKNKDTVYVEILELFVQKKEFLIKIQKLHQIETKFINLYENS